MSALHQLAGSGGLFDGITLIQVLGAITLSGLSLGAAIALVLGVRGSDRIKIHNRDRAGTFSIVTGTLWEAAGGSWSDMARGINSVPTSVIGDSGLGDPGIGGTALALTLLTFAPRWERPVFPALFGIAAAVTYGQAGGIFEILVNIIRMGAAKITGGA
ncbi:hypothetical protein [Streptomyces sp. DH12]|uniref:hypothetical protein n=1 Tax=Streptomyces sp. DH12 TaxID=2857010 RepID=UPI001E620A3C|nr:hypothetical protein [Streptomyces sp. DH12]